MNRKRVSRAELERSDERHRAVSRCLHPRLALDMESVSPAPAGLLQAKVRCLDCETEGWTLLTGDPAESYYQKAEPGGFTYRRIL